MPNEQEKLLTGPEVAKMLSVSVSTLGQWRAAGKGPKFVKNNRWVRYRKSAVDAWVNGGER